ncbi:hypothetical protein [Olsenella sp. Marseille-P4559]|uniref:hypothetical protein n=1 Tax=Olsenella sp. Marseille-P4559 TaxID=2364795 RepID=UPI001F5EBE1F|nr:hypothetical protein [Olsenella sp. Marseille-P4559]
MMKSDIQAHTHARRVVATGLAAALSLGAALPASAYAATSVSVQDTEYTTAASGSGSRGGTWSWDGKDGMSLVDYDGGKIGALGDLTITTTGKNTVAAASKDGNPNNDTPAIAVADGDLTVTGPGSLDATADNDHAVGAIKTVNGDLSIKDTTVSATQNATDNYAQSGAIEAADGSVAIEGSTVDAKTVIAPASGEEGKKAGTYGIYSDTVDGTEASVTIDNSTVTASSEGAAPGWNRGIGAYGNSYVTSSPSVTITNSDVVADGDPAITAYSRNQSLPGVVKVGMPATVTPAGVRGRKIDNGEFYGMTIAMAPVDSLSSSTKNSGGSHVEIKAAGNPQTVDENTFGGTTTVPAEASVQEAESSSPAKTGPAAARAAKAEPAKAEPAAAEALSLPQTGDRSTPVAAVLATAAAGAVALAAGLRLRLLRR